MARELTPVQKIEQTIVRRYHEELWSPFCKAIKRYQLIAPGDRIAVCVSGGKDSMLLAKMIQILARHSPVPFQAEYLILDPGYQAETRRQVEENAMRLEIPYTLFETDVLEAVNAQEKDPCLLRARMRRDCLYGKAQAMGCNKIALGHHFDDVIGAIVMGMFYGGQLQGMAPKEKSKKFPGMELIRPLYLVREENVIAWARANEFQFIHRACRLKESSAMDRGEAKRQEIKHLIRKLKKTNPTIEENIFSSIHNLQLDTMVGWSDKGKQKSFLDDYAP